ncbi:MAG: endonuclease/exonuclease/phosphatase family protein [Ignavibacteriales bacterium]|nr:endonuclease/exonuclease/phosphatase family protein [Ignavibacteriales bacterium]
MMLIERTTWQRIAASAILALCVSLPGCTAGRHAVSSSPVVRILTYNVHHGEGTDGKVDVERIARIILDSKADLVALQEVDRGVERSGKIDMITMLSDLTGMTYAFGRIIDYQGGQYGNAVLTRFPILAEKNLHFEMLGEGEQRGLLQLVVEARGHEIVFMNTHLDPRDDDTQRLMCIKEIIGESESYGERAVFVGGDFNDIPGSRTHDSIKAEFHDCWEIVGSGKGFTYPTENPSKRIDFLFLKKNKQNSFSSLSWKPVFARVLSHDASDHLPLLVEFELKPEN